MKRVGCGIRPTRAAAVHGMAVGLCDMWVKLSAAANSIAAIVGGLPMLLTRIHHLMVQPEAKDVGAVLAPISSPADPEPASRSRSPQTQLLRPWTSRPAVS